MSPEAEERARLLLLAHLSAEQRAQWLAEGRVTVVKRGVVWSVVLRDLLYVLPVLLLMVVPGWRMTGFLLATTLVVGLLPLWLPAFLIACSRRREWVITPVRSPELRARGKRIRFCVAFQEPLPAGDRVLAWKHLIEVSEPQFLRTANVRAAT